MKTNFLEVTMGAVVVLTTVCFVIFAYSTRQWSLQGECYNVSAKFDRIDGITKGSDVKLSGVKIGTVRAISLDSQNYAAVVTLELSSSVQLPKDSSAEITSEGLLGGKFISLVPGADDYMIPPQGEILYTQSSVSLESLIGRFIFNTQEQKESSEHHE